METSIDWQFDPAMGCIRAPREGAATFQSVPYAAACERLAFGEGFAVCGVSACCETEMAFQAPPAREGLLHLQFLASGACTFYSDDRSRRLAPGRDVLSSFLFASRSVAGWSVPADSPLKIVSIDLSEGQLGEWFGHTLPRRLRTMLSSREPGTVAVSPAAAPFLNGLAARMAGAKPNGATHRIAIEGAALQAVAAALEPLAEERLTGETGLNFREERALDRVRERLLADLRTPPDLTTLAGEAGMAPRRLQMAFRVRFGLSLFQALQNARLDYAKAVLQEGECSVKEIAWRTGYAHPASFTHAFRNRFGLPPSAFMAPRRRG
ncbi:Regulatory protein PchR [Methyloligella halotolerans]|uniref:Regulatory protein PchR n=1 Tax=Methyloligella halotolerans TaxID=1177755 RepID=A0A1E2RUR1_9HYPH|nr:AraC family transcriptional regulator [Methyloligella halotolerans]ODA65987.1 Regulatory protein PchR [Methyloligella halotolerans]